MNAIVRQLAQAINHKTAMISPRLLFIGTLLVGVIGVTANTIASFLSHGLHGDMVAQQVMVEQWSHGIPPLEAQTEATNYIIKFPVYLITSYVIADPIVRLVGVSILFNVTAWLLIWYFSRKIMQLSGVISQTGEVFLSLVMVILAILSPFIFWIDYPNSRNIELGFMLGLVYLLLLIYKKVKIKLFKLALLGVVSGVVFVNDPLSLYLVLVPFVVILLLYELLRRERLDRDRIGKLAVFAGTGVASYFVVKTYVLSLLIHVPDKVSGVSIPHGDGVVYSLVNITQGLAYNAGLIPAFKLGDSISGIIFTVVLAITSATLLVIIFMSLWRPIKQSRRSLQYVLLLSSAAALCVVYASGYLAPLVDLLLARYIVIVSLLLFIVAVIGFMEISKNAQVYSLAAVLFCVLIAGFALVRIQAPHLLQTAHFKEAWQQKNHRVYTLIETAKKYNIQKGYSSIQTAQPTTYLSGRELTMVPVMCDKSVPGAPVQRAYEWLVEARSVFIPTKNTMIEVATKPSDFNPCAKDLVIKQIGQSPLAAIDSGEDHTILIYNKDIRNQLYGLPKSFYDEKRDNRG